MREKVSDVTFFTVSLPDKIIAWNVLDKILFPDNSHKNAMKKLVYIRQRFMINLNTTPL